MVNKLNYLLNYISNLQHGEINICGYFNINLLDIENYLACNIIELMSSNSCLPIISRLTRIDERSANFNYNSGCLLSTISDHHQTFFICGFGFNFRNM